MRVVLRVVRDVSAVLRHGGDTAVAGVCRTVHEGRVVAGRGRADRHVGKGSDVAAVDQDVILALDRDAAQRIDRAAVRQVLGVDRVAVIRRGSRGNVRVFAVVINMAVHVVIRIVQNVVTAGGALERQVGGVDRLDIAGVIQRVVAAAGPGAGAGDAQDGRGLAVVADLLRDVSADRVAVGVGGMEREHTGVIYVANAGRADVDRALDALDDAAAEVVHRVVAGRNGSGAVGVLVGLDVCRAADRTDHTVVHEGVVAVACAGGGVLGVDLAVQDLADGRAELFLFLIIDVARIAAGGAVHLLPDVGVVPPVVAVVDRVGVGGVGFGSRFKSVAARIALRSVGVRDQGGV